MSEQPTATITQRGEEPRLKNDREIDAAFTAMRKQFPEVSALLTALGFAATEACKQCWHAAYIQGQSDALRYHIEKMARAKESSNA